MSYRHFRPSYATLLLGWLAAVPLAQAQQVQQLESVRVVGTAEQAQKESLGVSVITDKDLEKRPPASDLSEILRAEPGVNLTGSASSGMRGNRRQLDIRGMGPDNTLVLIDGRPANSRNAARQGWTGERDTDGDTGWVPPEAIERVEVLRGPAAARYGTGAMGGVVNIITKKPTSKLSGSITHYQDFHKNSDEGESRRTTFLLSGPISDRLGFRLYGGYAKTEPDALDINRGHAFEQNGIVSAAGKTGKRDKYINGEFILDIDDRQSLELNLGFSRKSDLYSGDTQNLNSPSTEAGGTFIPVTSLYGSETTVVYRSSMGLTHRGDWAWGTSRVGLSYGETRNSRDTEGLFGGPEGAFLSGTAAPEPRYVSEYKEWRLDGEVNMPLQLAGMPQTLTVGAEVLRESLEDPGSLRALRLGAQNLEPAQQLAGRDGETKTAYTSFAVYVEDNIKVSDALTLTPTVRFNHHQKFGSNISPGLTLTYAINDAWTIKGGIARAYKTPNMYQANPNYLLYSNGIGCLDYMRTPINPNGGCYLQGNEDLSSETSLNKEIGLAYDAGGLRASVAYFHNAYKNKIIAGVDPIGQVTQGTRSPYVLRWTNTPKAEVSGLEGNLFLPLSESVTWNTNATYMISSKDKTYDQPLSIIPKYTVNSWLDWAATEKLSLQATLTWYGKQEAATYDIRRGDSLADTPSLSPYALVGLNAGYEINKNLSIRAGVKNLFNKTLYREGLNSGTDPATSRVLGAGARTYNEHGRTFFATLTARF